MNKSEWKQCLLGDVIELKRGYDLPKNSRTPGAIPIVSSGGISGSHSEAKASGPGVVTGRYGTIGQVFWIEGDYWPLNTTLYVRDFKGNDPRFVSYFLQTIDFLQFSDKAAVPGINRNHLHEAGVHLPPLPEQKAIANILGTLDDKIELNRQMNETLESMARALFKSWFVDFDPVRAKMDGRQPPGLSPEVAALFPDKLVHVDGELIPEGWRKEPIEQIASIKHGFAFKGEFFRTEPTQSVLLTPGNFAIGGGFKGDKLKYYDGPIEDDYVLDAGDLLVTMTDLSKLGDTLGYPAFVPSLRNTQLLHNQRLGKVILKSDSTIGSEYLYQTLCLPSYRHHVLGSATGSTVKHSSPSRIGEFPSILPSTEIAGCFESIGRSVRELSMENMSESIQLSTIRDTLLPKLLSGELRVSDAEKQLT